MIGWLIFIAILFLLSILPIGIYGVYNASGAGLQMLLGPIRVRIGKTEHKPKPKKKKSTDAPFASHETKKKKSSGKDYTQYLSLIRPVLRFLADFRHKLKVDDLQLKVILAGGDPCDLSVNYGHAWIALGNVMPHLERYFVIRKRNLEIECDYIGDRTTVDFSIRLTITVFCLLQIVFYHGITVLCEYFKILKKTKDGAAI